LTLTELIRTSRPGSLTANDLTSSLSATLKIAVFAPIPSASVTTAIKVKLGFFNNIRAP
jgi:hypothetical protein